MYERAWRSANCVPGCCASCLSQTIPTPGSGYGHLNSSLCLMCGWGWHDGWGLSDFVCWWVGVRATLPPSMLFADRVLLCRGYSISEPNAWGETVSKPLGLTLGLVYNLSRLQLTRRSLHSIAKQEWHGWICRPWWVLQAIKRRIGCRSAVWIECGWVGREQGGDAKGSRCRADLFLGPLVCKAVGERRVQRY